MIDINKELKNSILNKNKELTDLLRLVKSEFLKKEKEVGRNNAQLTENEQFTILKKMCSQREEAIKIYQSAQRHELADKEQKELGMLRNYLPQEISPEQLKEKVITIIDEYSKNIRNENFSYVLSMKDMKPICEILTQTTPMFDKKIVAETIKNLS